VIIVFGDFNEVSSRSPGDFIP